MPSDDKGPLGTRGVGFLPPFEWIRRAMEAEERGDREARKKLLEAETLYDFVEQAPEFRRFLWQHQDGPDFLGANENGVQIAIEITELVGEQESAKHRLIDELTVQLEWAICNHPRSKEIRGRWWIHFPLGIPDYRTVGRSSLQGRVEVGQGRKGATGRCRGP